MWRVYTKHIKNGGYIILIELKGQYNEAKVFADAIDEKAVGQIIQLLNQKWAEGLQIRIMPDVHAGKGCTIGTTMEIKDKVVPNLVGVDIGCGMEVVKLHKKKIDFKRLDQVIRERIPVGTRIRKYRHRFNKFVKYKELRCQEHVDIHRAKLSIGTLGGGNHFIELNEDEKGAQYLVVHSGSRHLGNEVAKYHQKKAIDYLENLGVVQYQRDLAYLEGWPMQDYINDMKIIQSFATYNRKAIVEEIMEGLGLESSSGFTTIHNYIDTDTMILRKGAISAKEGEKVLIPLNMRDGSLICEGLGNSDWNCSAPHGAGRIMSRGDAKVRLSMKEFKKTMEGVYSSTISKRTLDEAPMAYKPMESILEQIEDTVKIKERLKPLYNFKGN